MKTYQKPQIHFQENILLPVRLQGTGTVGIPLECNGQSCELTQGFACVSENDSITVVFLAPESDCSNLDCHIIVDGTHLDNCSVLRSTEESSICEGCYVVMSCLDNADLFDCADNPPSSVVVTCTGFEDGACLEAS